jgi:hypothetical protein
MFTPREEIENKLSSSDLYIYDSMVYNAGLIFKSISTYEQGIFDCEYDIEILTNFVSSNMEAANHLKTLQVPPINKIKQIKKEIETANKQIKNIKEQIVKFRYILDEKKKELEEITNKINRFLASRLESKVIDYEAFRSKRNK